MVSDRQPDSAGFVVKPGELSFGPSRTPNGSPSHKFQRTAVYSGRTRRPPPGAAICRVIRIHPGGSVQYVGPAPPLLIASPGTRRRAARLDADRDLSGSSTGCDADLDAAQPAPDD